MAYAHLIVYVDKKRILVHGGNNSEIMRDVKELENISYQDFCKRFPNGSKGISEKIFNKTYLVEFRKT